MRAVGLAALFLAAVLAAIVLFLRRSAQLPCRGHRVRWHPHAPAAPRDAAATPVPRTWIDGLARSRNGIATLISCLDADGDGQISGSDGDALDGLDIPFVDAGAASTRSISATSTSVTRRMRTAIDTPQRSGPS